MSVVRWRKKPVEFEAVQWTGGNLAEMQAFCGTRKARHSDDLLQAFEPIGTYISDLSVGNDAVVFTGELWVAANLSISAMENGEWVIKDSLGFYSCKDEIIKRNNDPIGVS